MAKRTEIVCPHCGQLIKLYKGKLAESEQTPYKVQTERELAAEAALRRDALVAAGLELGVPNV